MTFSETQIRKLRRRPSRKFVKTRENEGREFQYLEGWHAISEANRIFGYDAWNRETVWFECVWRQPQGMKFAAAYLARVRIVVRTDRHLVIREGTGAGEAITQPPVRPMNWPPKPPKPTQPNGPFPPLAARLALPFMANQKRIFRPSRQQKRTLYSLKRRFGRG